MTSLQFLFLGLAFVWVILGGYMVFLVRRQARLRHEAAALRLEMKKLERGPREGFGRDSARH